VYFAEDDDNEKIYATSEEVRHYAQDILRRTLPLASKEQQFGQVQTPCSLETILKSGPGTRTLWAETPQVIISNVLVDGNTLTL
jgi:hypothetical protein